MAERAGDMDKWLQERISYLAGNTWPEAWLLHKCTEAPDKLGAALGVDANRAMAIVEYSLQAGKNEGFTEMGEQVNLDAERCLILTCGVAYKCFPHEFNDIRNTIDKILT
ncbi:hypothetical protein HUW52_10810 [Pseudomonas sp. 43A]|uniref:hypothetical protein n=2 Tax=unclassified Pseudomonas TaxID=196821 RepID=UPI0015874E56|nr:hypothetical protein [Pseudomonas sp. 43A]QKV63350.1 hypothetical protein HUW52_10810 [Pseudomonas sp. 43A]